MIRKAVSRDAAAIAAIWNPIIQETTITFTTEEKTESSLVRLIDEAPAFLVCDDTEIEGFALYSQFRSGPGYARTMELTIHVAPHARSKGTGRALVQALIDEGTEQKIGTLWAGISGENMGAVAFHERLGFRKSAVLPSVGFKFGRWIDLTLMYRAITASGAKGAVDPHDISGTSA